MKVYESDAAAEKELITWWKRNKYYLAIAILGVDLFFGKEITVKWARK